MAHSTPQLLVICSLDVMHRSTVRSPSFWPQTLFLAAAGNLKPIKSSPSSGVSCAEVLGELGLFDAVGFAPRLDRWTSASSSYGHPTKEASLPPKRDWSVDYQLPLANRHF